MPVARISFLAPDEVSHKQQRSGWTVVVTLAIAVAIAVPMMMIHDIVLFPKFLAMNEQHKNITSSGTCPSIVSSQSEATAYCTHRFDGATTVFSKLHTSNYRQDELAYECWWNHTMVCGGSIIDDVAALPLCSQNISALDQLDQVCNDHDSATVDKAENTFQCWDQQLDQWCEGYITLENTESYHHSFCPDVISSIQEVVKYGFQPEFCSEETITVGENITNDMNHTTIIDNQVTTYDCGEFCSGVIIVTPSEGRMTRTSFLRQAHFLENDVVWNSLLVGTSFFVLVLTLLFVTTTWRKRQAKRRRKEIPYYRVSLDFPALGTPNGLDLSSDILNDI